MKITYGSLAPTVALDQTKYGDVVEFAGRIYIVAKGENASAFWLVDLASGEVILNMHGGLYVRQVKAVLTVEPTES